MNLQNSTSITDKRGRGSRSAESSAYYASHRNERLAYARNYSVRHKAKKIASRSRSYRRHRATRLAKQAEWRAANQARLAIGRAARREEISEYNKCYARQNHDQIKSGRKLREAANPEAVRARRRRYHASPAGKASIANSRHRRRSLMSNGSSTPTSAQLLILRAMAKHCFYCKDHDAPLTYDHFIPLNGINGDPLRRGRHEIENIVMACHPCNSGKKDRDPHEFINSLKIAA